jgi:hypothetical protein
VIKIFILKLLTFFLQQNYFCGFSSRTVRNICEQVDNTEVQPEVFNVLAEDATYKLMEIINVRKNQTFFMDNYKFIEYFFDKIEYQKLLKTFWRKSNI